VTRVDGDLLNRLESVLRDHEGPDEAITSAELSDELAISDSEAQPATREAIRVLCAERGLPVAAGPQGYYMIQTEQQLDDYLDTLRARKQGIESRMWHVRKAWRESNGHGQMTFTEGPA